MDNDSDMIKAFIVAVSFIGAVLMILVAIAWRWW